MKSKLMVQSKNIRQITSKNGIIVRSIFPFIAYWDLLFLNTFQLDNLYFGTGAVAVLGFWGLLKNSFILKRGTILSLVLIIIPSIIGYVYYGTSPQAVFSLFIAVGISFYVNYFVTYRVLEHIICMISKTASYLSMMLIIFYPILEEEGRLFLISNEPSHIAIALIGPLFYFGYKKNVFYLFPVIVAILLTQSLSVFLSGFIFILCFRNRINNRIIRNNLKKVFVLLVISYLATLIPAIAWRLSTFSVLWLNFSFSNINGTFFSFLSHAMTYFILILPNYTVGLGFSNYQEFLMQPEIQEYYSKNPVFVMRLTNEYGGHSMFLRMANELSLFVIFLGHALVQRLRKMQKNADFAVFAFLTVLILSRCLKLSGYFDFGFLFFILAILIVPVKAASKSSHQ